MTNTDRYSDATLSSFIQQTKGISEQESNEMVAGMTLMEKLRSLSEQIETLFPEENTEGE